MNNTIYSGDQTFSVIIAGSRGFSDYDLLCEKCDKLFSRRKPTSILCGEANGADSLGKRYAKEHGIPVESYPARWDQYGKSAGMMRNKQMLADADALVAFWDGESHGTKNMLEIAENKGIPVRIIWY